MAYAAWLRAVTTLSAMQAALASRRCLTAGQAWLIGWLSVALGAAPLLATAPAPLVDWPGHLARVWVIERVLQGDPFWNARYVFQGFLLPNAILDVALAGLQRAGLAGPAAGSLYLLALYGLFVGGFRRLAQSAGAESALTAPLAAAAFYSLPLFWGFVNFMTGISVMLWLLAAYVRPGGFWRRAGIAALGGAAVAFCHIIAAALFVGVLGCLDLVRLWRAGWRAPLTLAPPCLGALTVLAALAGSPVAGNGLSRIIYRNEGSLLGLAYGKASIWAKTLLSLHVGPDVLLALALAVTAAIVWRLRPRPALPWAAAAGALVVVSLAAPDWIGQSAFLDARIPAVAVVVLAATTPLRGAGRPLALALCGLLAGRSVWLAADFARTGRTYAVTEAALAALPKGATLLAGRGQPDAARTWWSFWPPQVTLAVRHGIFVPQMFAIPVQQPLALRPEWREWSYFRDLRNPAERQAALAQARGQCDGPTFLMTFYPYGAPAEPIEGRLPGALGRSARMERIC